MVLIGDVPVQPHCSRIALTGNTTHVDRTGSLGVGDGDSRMDDLIPAERAGLAPAPMMTRTAPWRGGTGPNGGR